MLELDRVSISAREELERFVLKLAMCKSSLFNVWRPFEGRRRRWVRSSWVQGARCVSGSIDGFAGTAASALVFILPSSPEWSQRLIGNMQNSIQVFRLSKQTFQEIRCWFDKALFRFLGFGTSRGIILKLKGFPFSLFQRLCLKFVFACSSSLLSSPEVLTRRHSSGSATFGVCVWHLFFFTLVSLDYQDNNWGSLQMLTRLVNLVMTTNECCVTRMCCPGLAARRSAYLGTLPLDWAD